MLRGGQNVEIILVGCTEMLACRSYTFVLSFLFFMIISVSLAFSSLFELTIV